MAEKYTLHEVRQLKSAARSRTGAEERKVMFWRDLDNVENAVYAFSVLMRDEMFDHAAEGYEGWGNEEYKEQIEKHLAGHVKREKWIGVANFAMMLHGFTLQSRRASETKETKKIHAEE